MSTPMGSGTYVDQDESGVSIDITKYRGCKTDCKSTSGTCHILGNALVSWSCKKQACASLSTAEAEYFAVRTLGEVRNNTEQGGEKSPTGKESFAIHGAFEPRKTHNPATEAAVNLDELSNNDLITTAMPGIAKKLRSRKGNFVVTTTPPRSRYGPPKAWSKEVPRSNKRKIRDNANSDGDAEVNVQDIPHEKIPDRKKKDAVMSDDSYYDVEDDIEDTLIMKKFGMKKLHVRVLDAPMNNVSFHYRDNLEQWKYVYQRRIALERELRKDAVECSKIMELIFNTGLKKIVTMRGRCVDFSPTIINMYMDRSEYDQSELKVTDNQVCTVIAANQMKTWPVKDKLPAS
ncbi:uncharacterized protein LOC131631655 [Vicia villosa]|uniref:uncharacterized protein LOC131631655 n=1 Tax=Vicia villosa TaxID=3911 RepID=UPI00273BA6AC|nr:uncharacterized protein LOC131631655 [Vicia villosa]